MTLKTDETINKTLIQIFIQFEKYDEAKQLFKRF